MVCIFLSDFLAGFLNSRRCCETNSYPIYEETLITHESNRFRVESVITTLDSVFSHMCNYLQIMDLLLAGQLINSTADDNYLLYLIL